MDGICEYREWDSEFFGIRIARLAGATLDSERAKAALTWCRAHEIDCVYFLAAPDHRETGVAAQANRFQLVDIRITLDRPAGGETVDAPAVREFRAASDACRLREIARVSHRDTRFYYDERFPRSRCDALYETWIERSSNGWADAVFVAESGGVASGYISCHLSPSGVGSIGLCAVAEEAQGKGLGNQLVQAASRYFQGQGMKRVTVVTQGRNVGAQRLYQRCGFRTCAVQLWYHRWFSGGLSE